MVYRSWLWKYSNSVSKVQLSGWFVLKTVKKSCLNLLKLRPNYYQSLFSGHGVEWQVYLMVKNVMIYVQRCRRNTGVWQTDRRTDGQTNEQISCDSIVRAMHTRRAVIKTITGVPRRVRGFPVTAGHWPRGASRPNLMTLDSKVQSLTILPRDAYT